MHDFSAKYRGVAHFGLWAEEGADLLGHRDAWAILCHAVRRCTIEDLRGNAEIENALAWFEKRLARPRPITDFRKALDIHAPMERWSAVDDAVKRIGKYMNIL